MSIIHHRDKKPPFQGNGRACEIASEHRLANFDLPWNPMEIKQHIGRLHLLGQQPVRTYNFVQAGTLQEHLLEVSQENSCARPARWWIFTMKR